MGTYSTLHKRLVGAGAGRIIVLFHFGCEANAGEVVKIVLFAQGSSLYEITCVEYSKREAKVMGASVVTH